MSVAYAIFKITPDVRRLPKIVERFWGEERLLNSQNAQASKQSYYSKYCSGIVSYSKYWYLYHIVSIWKVHSPKH